MGEISPHQARMSTPASAGQQELAALREKLSEQSSERQKLSGMKSLIAMISEGINVSDLFPQVVKTIICPNMQVRQLVHLYLMHYAEFRPEEALLSVNTLQMHLKSPDAVIRAQSLRVLTSIRLPIISQLQVVALEGTVRDASPYVRRATMHGITKVYQLAPQKLKYLLPLLQIGLADADNFVLSSALGAFLEVTPRRYDLIHAHYHRYCQVLLDLDDWGKVYLLRILTHYIRVHFAAPPVPASGGEFLDSDTEERDPDLRLISKSMPHLLRSHSAAVTGAAIAWIYYCGSPRDLYQVVFPLLRLVRDPRTSTSGLATTRTIASTHPDLFTRFVSDFYLLSSDPSEQSLCKLDILSHLFMPSTTEKIIRELEYYLNHCEFYSPVVISHVIQNMGQCMLQSEENTTRILPLLLRLLFHPNPRVMAQCIIQIKNLLQRNPRRASQVMAQLLKVDWMKLSHVDARCHVIWMFGEYAGALGNQGPDLLRVLVRNFTKEPQAIRQQILNLAVKLLLQCGPREPTVVQMFQYVCTLCRYDSAYDIRDRVRMIETIILTSNCPELKSKAVALLLPSKPHSDIDSSRDMFVLSSMSAVIGSVVPGYAPLEEWAESTTHSKARGEAPADKPSITQRPKENTNPSTDDFWGFSADPQASLAGFYSDEEESIESESDTE